MKKYLMKGFAAIVFCGAIASCSHDMDSGSDAVQTSVIEKYEKAFVTRFGEPVSTQTWGFGASAKAGSRGAYPNANMWAIDYVIPDPLTNDQKELVRQYFQQVDNPDYDDPKWTNYFVQQVYKGGTKCKNNGDNNSLTTEVYQSANNGWVTGSNHMDHLESVAEDGTHDHIFNFNNGDCSWNENVQDNNTAVNDAKQHKDQIQLMVNSSTYSFGYFNSDGSLGHTDYTGLVGWKTIRDWAIKKGIYDEEKDILNDGWNRSYMGFDFEQVIGDDVYDKINQVWENNQLKSYDIHYAKYSEAPESPQYIWDGTNVIPIANQEDITEDFTGHWNNSESHSFDNGVLVYNSASWGGLSAWLGGQDLSQYSSLVVEFDQQLSTTAAQIVVERDGAGNLTKWIDQWSISGELVFDGNTDLTKVKQIAIQTQNAATIRIKKIYLKAKEGYMIYNDKPVPYLSSDQNTYCGDFKEYTSDDDVKIRKQYNGSEVVCLRWDKLVSERLSKDYLPVAGSNMKKWVKVEGGADGYYSDWIVTLTKAKKPGDNVEDDDDEIVVLAEDLTIDDVRPDFDFNDVVFKVTRYTSGEKNGQVWVTLLAAGGTLHLTVDGHEVHEEFAKTNPDKVIVTTTMINTAENAHTAYKTASFQVTNPSGSNIQEIANNIPVVVTKFGEQIPLVAPTGGVPSKIAVGTDFLTDPGRGWCDERQDIDEKYNVKGTALFKGYVRGDLDDNWYTLIRTKTNQ